MSPIRETSEIIRIPRIGKIRLGIKVQGENSQYPKAVDYFVCPPEVEEVFGEKPKELDIMFPVEDPDMFAQQWLKRYSLSQGLTCIGDGERCRRKVDTDTGDFASHTTENWVWKEDLSCNYGLCPEYNNKRCRRVMNLQFLIPEVVGLGVWQIDTSSFYSIVNINSMIALLKGIFGRCSMLPLTLALGEIEVSPLGIKKKKVHVMHIRQDNIRLAQLARMSLAPVGKALLEIHNDEDERPDDLFPEDIIGEYTVEPTLTKQKTGKRRSAPKAKKANSPSPPAYVDPEVSVFWGHIKDYLKQKGAPEVDNLKKWFRDHHEMDITGDEFEEEYYPEKFTKHILSHLHESLLAYFEKRI